MMAEVFELTYDADKYQCLGVVGEDTSIYDLFLWGKPILDDWTPPLVRVRAEEGEHPLPSDFPGLIGWVPVLSTRAYAALEPLLVGRAQTFPLFMRRDRPAPYVALNVTRLVEGAIDFEKSALVGRPGDVTLVLKYEFRHNVVADEVIFRDAQYTNSNLVTNRFVEAVEAANLEGALFAYGYLNYRKVRKQRSRARSKPKH